MFGSSRFQSLNQLTDSYKTLCECKVNGKKPQPRTSNFLLFVKKNRANSQNCEVGTTSVKMLECFAGTKSYTRNTTPHYSSIIQYMDKGLG